MNADFLSGERRLLACFRRQLAGKDREHELCG